jgi:hypothetical protein
MMVDFVVAVDDIDIDMMLARIEMARDKLTTTRIARSPAGAKGKSYSLACERVTRRFARPSKALHPVRNSPRLQSLGVLREMLHAAKLQKILGIGKPASQVEFGDESALPPII